MFRYPKLIPQFDLFTSSLKCLISTIWYNENHGYYCYWVGNSPGWNHTFQVINIHFIVDFMPHFEILLLCFHIFRALQGHHKSAPNWRNANWYQVISKWRLGLTCCVFHGSQCLMELFQKQDMQGTHFQDQLSKCKHIRYFHYLKEGFTQLQCTCNSAPMPK